MFSIEKCRAVPRFQEDIVVREPGYQRELRDLERVERRGIEAAVAVAVNEHLTPPWSRHARWARHA